MKKKISVIIVSFLAVLTATILYVSDISATGKESYLVKGSCGYSMTFTLYDNGELVINGIGLMNFVYMHITPWNAYKSEIKKVTIGEGVQNIGDFAFSRCTSLEKIYIPSSVKSIGENVFMECTSLSDVEVDKKNVHFSYMNGILYNTERTRIIFAPVDLSGTVEIPDGVKKIGYEFQYCSDITSIEIPKSMTDIYAFAFEYCTGLERITVKDGNTNYSSYGGILYDYAMTNILCVPLSITGNVVIPDKITRIESQFLGCDKITSIEIHAGVINITPGAFWNCYSMTSINVNERNPYYSSENGILYNHRKDQLVSIPPNITGTVVIHDGVTTIKYDAALFLNRKNITSVYIPTSVTGVALTAFEGCTGLEYINVDPSNKTYYSFDGILYKRNYSSILVVPKSIKGIVEIPGGITEIGNEEFNGCAFMTGIGIPASVKVIRLNVFDGCLMLENIKVDPANMYYTSINGILFNKNKDSIICYPAAKAGTSYMIPAGIKSINNGAFSNCRNLKSITVDPLNKSYFSDGGVLFNMVRTDLICYPAGKTESTYAVPDYVKNILYMAFSGCKDLKEVLVPDSVTSIGDEVFNGCCSLEEITLPFVGGNADYSVNYRAGSFGYIFGDTPYDGSVKIQQIYYLQDGSGHYLFAYLPVSLKHVTITLGQINQYAFSGCNSFEIITFETGVSAINKGAFYECEEIECIYVYNPECKILSSPVNSTIYGFTGSTAQTYALVNNQDFVHFVEFSGLFATTVILKEVTGYEYKLEGGEWQDSPVFTGLFPDTEYTFYQRIKTTSSNEASKPVVGFSEKTKSITFILTALVSGSDLIVETDTGYIKGIAAGITHEQIMTEFKDHGKVRVVDKIGDELTGSVKIGTGNRIQVLDDAGNVIEEVTVVVKGDVTGSGTIGTLDYIRLRAYLNGNYELKGVYLEAALMINDESNVTELSCIHLREFMLGIYELY